MKLIDALLCLVILTVMTFAVRSVIRARKSGKSCGICAGDCASCSKQSQHLDQQ